MSDLEERFIRAKQEVEKLPKRPSDTALLKLYGLYKQGTEGDVHGDKPGFTEFTKMAKYEAWTKLKGTTKEKAMEDYIKQVESLKKKASFG
jgi:acyl-CoA-binding protein